MLSSLGELQQGTWFVTLYGYDYLYEVRVMCFVTITKYDAF